MRALARVCAALILCGCPSSVIAAESSRFSGGGELRVADPQSVDGRFAMQARLQRDDRSVGAGRFELNARMSATDPGKAVTAAVCDGLFANGFEG